MQSGSAGIYSPQTLLTAEEPCPRKNTGLGRECPACACGDITFLGPEKLREKFIGDEKEIEVLCPMCGTKHKGKMEEAKD